MSGGRPSLCKLARPGDARPDLAERLRKLAEVLLLENRKYRRPEIDRRKYRKYRKFGARHESAGEPRSARP